MSSTVACLPSICSTESNSAGRLRRARVTALRRPTCSGWAQPVSCRPQSRWDMKATGDPPAAELPDRSSPAGNEEKNRAIPHAGRREALRFVEDLEAVQPYDIGIGLSAVRILSGEGGALHREYGFRRRSIDANR